jgi:membrane associated rhomboid family serine protease
MWPVWSLLVLSAGIELLLLAADQGFVGSTLWRRWAYANGAFWTGLLTDWQPNYVGQPIAMFLSYSVLHAGPGHVAGNLAALWVLGRHVCRALGPWCFLLVYLLSTLGGAVAYALLSASPSPMVGASGALFGLAGAALALQRADPSGWRRTLAGFVGLFVVNALSWVLAGGQMAWQAHLGGTLAGAAVAAALRRRDNGPGGRAFLQAARAKSRS